MFQIITIIYLLMLFYLEYLNFEKTVEESFTILDELRSKATIYLRHTSRLIL